VAGIATATLTADWTGLLLGLAITLCGGLFSSSPAVSPIRWRELADGPSLHHLFALNRDILVRTVSLVAAFAWFTRAGARMGDATLAANAVLLNLQSIASYALDGFANATEALVGESVGARRRADYRAILRASTVSAFLVAALISLFYFLFGDGFIRIFTNQESVRLLAMHYLPWAVMLPLISVAGFQLDGIFIGATRARDLRNSMLIASAVYLALAIVLERLMGNNGLWCAFSCFMALRGVTLGWRLPRIEKGFSSASPVSSR
jgi:MATE family multidrug resistance protein